MTEIQTAVAYRIGVTDADTTAAEAFAAGQGVCQDHAHIFSGAVRHLGIPSRYVTGYLALEGEEIGHEASHAWAGALPDLGAVGFDPANGKCPTGSLCAGGRRHRRARHYPITGAAAGRQHRRNEVEVNVEIAQQ